MSAGLFSERAKLPGRDLHPVRGPACGRWTLRAHMQRRHSTPRRNGADLRNREGLLWAAGQPVSLHLWTSRHGATWFHLATNRERLRAGSRRRQSGRSDFVRCSLRAIPHLQGQRRRRRRRRAVDVRCARSRKRRVPLLLGIGGLVRSHEHEQPTSPPDRTKQQLGLLQRPDDLRVAAVRRDRRRFPRHGWLRTTLSLVRARRLQGSRATAAGRSPAPACESRSTGTRP